VKKFGNGGGPITVTTDVLFEGEGESEIQRPIFGRFFVCSLHSRRQLLGRSVCAIKDLGCDLQWSMLRVVGTRMDVLTEVPNRRGVLQIIDLKK
jgi:hypothetical protein